MGDFSVSRAYQRINQFHTLNESENWKKIWKINAPQKIRVFIWQLVHKRLTTKKRVVSWGIGTLSCHRFVTLKRPFCTSCVIALWLARFGYIWLNPPLEVNFNFCNSMSALDNTNWSSLWATTCYYYGCGEINMFVILTLLGLLSVGSSLVPNVRSIKMLPLSSNHIYIEEMSKF